MIPQPPIPTLFPYTTLFRSREGARRPPVHHHEIDARGDGRSEEHTSELQSLAYLVCRLLLEKKKAERQCIGLFLGGTGRGKRLEVLIEEAFGNRGAEIGIAF